MLVRVQALWSLAQSPPHLHLAHMSCNLTNNLNDYLILDVEDVLKARIVFFRPYHRPVRYIKEFNR